MKHPKGFALQVAHARALTARVEKQMGCPIKESLFGWIDLLCDNSIGRDWDQAVRIINEIDPTYAAPYMKELNDADELLA